MAAPLRVCGTCISLSRKLVSRACFTFTCERRYNCSNVCNHEDKETHFGFEKVSDSDKTKRVHEVFSNVAKKYDTMNDAMSLGIHRLWKDYFMHVLQPTPATHLLDVAGGTGDIAFRFLDFISHQKKASGVDEDWSDDERWSGLSAAEDYPRGGQEGSDVDSAPAAEHHVTVCDINEKMLKVGQKRARERGTEEAISWIVGDAEDLPIADDSMDAYTIAFGIRNVTHIDVALDEAYRVLKPGGRFLCLEFSEVRNPLLKLIYDRYSFDVIPVLGDVIAGDWKSYQYLVESIRQFPNQEDFSRMICDAGFSLVRHENISMGIAAIHSGFKL